MEGGGRQDTTTLSISFLGNLLSGGCDGLLPTTDRWRSPAAFLLAIVGLLSLPLLLRLSSDSLLLLTLILALLFLSNPGVPRLGTFSSVL